MNHITHIPYRWYKEIWNSLQIKMDDIKFAKVSLSVRIYNSIVPYRSNMLSYWLFISVYFFFFNLNWRNSKLRHNISVHILMLKIDYSDTHPQKHRQKTTNFTSYQWTVLPVYEWRVLHSLETDLDQCGIQFQKLNPARYTYP